ncbi:glycosyltransferase family 2 protein [Cryobacterium sp. TMT1-3]|uniref:glycosyltransferase family 2 protein n=1 Tax=Cryobacterium sp. TMT1-3 TaxID=1259237 RepID=UPI00106C0D6A|nr:glycosyltransferase family 2 protein [Cryobacterium sp. TMT1-3]TFC27314.1 glycosyltransferase family 2 protein [Cryobacterium sp. TMT1-3]
MAIPPNSRLESSRLAVVTVSYGSDDVIGAFLASLADASVEQLVVVIADNKCQREPNTISGLASDIGALYLPLGSNQGYGHAINEAVRTLPSTIEWIVVSNPDVMLTPGAIDTLLESAGNDLSIAAVGPRILSSTGDVYPSARTIPSLRSGVGHALFSGLWPRNPWTRTYRRELSTALARRDAGWLSGAFLMVRRSVFEQLAGFDESYFMYFEDVDLGYRISQLGLRNVYEPNSVVVHTGAHSTQGDESTRMIRAHHDSARRFLFKKYSGPLLFPLRVVLSLGLGTRARIEEFRTNRR